MEERTMKTMRSWTISSAVAVILVGSLAMGAMAQDATAKAVIPDAQIEANVLRALASAPELSTQNIQTATVYGTVTLSGNVHDESLRVKAENLAARADGVKKVVDQLTLGDTPATPAGDQAAVQPAQPTQNDQPDPSQSNQPVLLSDGTYGPAPDGSGALPAQNDASSNQPAPAPEPGRQPLNTGYGNSGYAQRQPPPPGQGQRAGMEVTVPAGAILQIRINRGLDSNHTQPGTNFDGMVLADVVAGGAVAIPRGAAVQGTVVDAKKAGTFKGQGELSLKINSITMGGIVYPVTTEVWDHNGRDKTAGTVNRTVGTSAIGALFGAAAGGGAGAAIGAGVGAGLGLAGSAASPRGEIIVPPESVLNFRTAQPLQVTTVSQAEMARLSYAAGPQTPAGPPMRRYYSPYYGYYYAPAYYPR
jgi:hypothetical protein